MKRLATSLALFTLSLSLGLAGCSDDGTTPTTESSDFEGYGSWTQVEYTNAASTFLGPAHQGSNPEFVRSIYTNNNDKVEGDYSVGTIFVKDTYTFDAEGNKEYPAAMGLLGMIKREDGFDTDYSNWEYFIIDPSDLSTISSGADLNDGGCKSCHSNASGSDGNDRIFNHPSEFLANNDSFADFATWNLIGTQQGPDALLGNDHMGNDENTVREIYKKQLQARPVSGDLNGYPVGTLLLKTVKNADGDIIAKTGMAKRGGPYDTDHSGWEYFMMDMDSGTMMPMGENSSMCIGCHTAATVAVNGQDYVFSHTDDPFNN